MYNKRYNSRENSSLISREALFFLLFVARKNDLAFTVKNRVLVISEHQSTVNENMPLRDLLYLGRTLEKLPDKRTLYKRKLVKIPTPEFFVFYYGVFSSCRGLPRSRCSLAMTSKRGCSLMREIASLALLARNDNALRPSLRGHLCPWQSPSWSNSIT